MTTDLRERLQQSLGSTYVLERELGGGGMSRVFVAEETSLGRRVVVKVLPPDLAAGVSAGRFRREIQLAARLQHPHIVPLLSAGEADGLLYYTMPMVEGESLRSRLERSGALPVADATALLRDVADALGCAHAQGVVHRDIKPENLLLSGRHAFVVDFGVAKALSAAAAAGAGTMTATNMVVGTPRYMAPEQALGDVVDHRADIYAFGVVAYETLAGAPPFEGGSFQQLVAAHVADAPAPLEARRADVPRAFAALVMRCLAKVPGERPQSADEILRTLEGMPAARTATPVPPAEPPRARFARSPRRAAAAAVLTLATVGALAGAAWRRTHRSQAALDSRRVLVLAFANRTGDRSLDAYGSMAADWIAQGITETGVAEVASPLGGVAAMAASGRAGAPPAELAREARAGKVLTGAVYRTGDSLRLQAQLGDANTGAVHWAIEPVSVPASNPMGGIGELRQRVTGALAMELEGHQLWGAALRSPPSFDAYQAFTEGTETFFRGDFAEATRTLLHAYELDSTFVMALTWAAQAQYNLRHYAQADTILTRAQRSRGWATPLFGGSLDYLMGAVHGDLPRSLAGAREMVRVAPHSEAQLILAQEATQSNRPHEAIAAVRELLKYPGWTRRYPSSWGWTTAPYHLLGQHEEELRLVRLGRAEFPTDMNLAAREAFALAALGRVDSAMAVVRTSPALRSPLGTLKPGELAEQTADELRAHGRAAADADTLDRLALEWARAAAAPAGARQAAPRARYALARALCRMGDRAAGLAVLDSLVIEHPDTVDFRGLHGTCAVGAGDRVRATRALAALTAIDRPYLFGEHLFWAARVAAALGDRERAVALLRQAFGSGLEFGLRLHRTPELLPLRGYPPFDEIVRPQG